MQPHTSPAASAIASLSPNRVVSVTNRLLCRVFSRDTAEHDDVGDRVAAQAVFAVDAAGHFSCGIQTGDHASVGLYDLRLVVDFDAAHRVMHCGHGFQNIERRFFVPYFTSPAKETIGKTVFSAMLPYCSIFSKLDQNYQLPILSPPVAEKTAI